MDFKRQSFLCQKTVSSSRKMQDIPLPRPLPPPHPSFTHSDTNRAMTLATLHRLIHNSAVSHTSSVFFFFPDSPSYPNLIPPTLPGSIFPVNIRLCWTDARHTVNRIVFGLELSLRSVGMLCYSSCINASSAEACLGTGTCSFTSLEFTC